jgi:hypothetical protein
MPAENLLDDEEGRRADDHERELEFLEGLKSPDFDEVAANGGGVRESMGGWGLGAGVEEVAKEDDDDENMNWDQAQAVVERMVGMKEQEPHLQRAERR